MSDKLDYISVNDYFWAQLNENFVSFGLQGLPANIHLTISFNQDKTDINFHLTKNSSNPKNKPKIEIFRIDKSLLEQTFNQRYFTILSNILEPIDTSTTLDYIPMREIEKDGQNTILNSFTDKDFQIKRQRRLKVNTDIEKKFNEISENPELQELFKTLRKPLDTSEELIEGGIIMTPTDSIASIKIFGSWYKFRDEITFRDLLKGIIEPRTVTQLTRRFKESIVRLKTANTFSDTEAENKKSIVLKKASPRN